MKAIMAAGAILHPSSGHAHRDDQSPGSMLPDGHARLSSRCMRTGRTRLLRICLFDSEAYSRTYVVA